MKKNSNSLLSVIILSLIFGISGGVFGEIIARVYFLQDAYNVPLLGNVNVPNNVYGGSNLIIESPKKVFVEQNTKSLETIRSANDNIVGIYEKIDVNNATSAIKVSDHYNLNKPQGQGSIVTSDGWIMSAFIPKEFENLKNDKTASTSVLIKEAIENYVVIKNDGIVFAVSDIKINKDLNVTFWRIDAKDLRVKKFKKLSEISKGQIAIAVNFQGQAWLSTVSDKYPKNLPDVLSSDVTYSELNLVNPLSKDFGEAFIFDIEGDVIALVNKEGKIKPVSSYFSCLSCLLERKELAFPYLGIKYIDLSNYSGSNSKKLLGEGAMVYPDDKGISVIKGSPAEKAGLLNGDIIKAVNTEKITKEINLSDMISEIKPGQQINLTILRGDKELQVNVVLGSR